MDSDCYIRVFRAYIDLFWRVPFQSWGASPRLPPQHYHTLKITDDVINKTHSPIYITSIL